MFFGCFVKQNTRLSHVVNDVDFDRYLGKWYEIARFPHRFEKDLVGVTATYTMEANGKIQVLNQGYKFDMNGELKKAQGRAKLVDNDKKGHLKVSFFLFFYADYYILALDKENYSYALVGSSGDNYLWVLGRKPQMDSDTYEMLVQKAQNLGYDISRLEKVPQ